MRENTRPSIMKNFDTELAALISKSRGVSLMDGLRIFLKSQTHGMLLDNEMRLWYFSPLAIFDMWENEEATGDPGNSLYLKGHPEYIDEQGYRRNRRVPNGMHGNVRGGG